MSTFLDDALDPQFEVNASDCFSVSAQPPESTWHRRFFVLRDVRRGYIERHRLTSGEIGTCAMHPPGKRSIDINKGQNHHDKTYRHRYARADTAVRPYAEICSMKGQPNTGHRQSNIETNQRDGGWNGERMCREPDISADGGCKPGIIRRLAGPAPSSMVITNESSPHNPVVTIGDGRPTCPHHVTNKRSRTEHQIGFS